MCLFDCWPRAIEERERDKQTEAKKKSSSKIDLVKVVVKKECVEQNDLLVFPVFVLN